MTLAIQRLTDDQRPALLAHLLSLPPADRRLRFGTALAPRVVAQYVARLDFARDAVFGAHEDDLSLAGIAHVAFEGERAEIGLSVLPRHRRRGVGAALLNRAIEHARNRCAKALCMQFLTGNTAIARMAQRLGMHVFTTGVETQARMNLPRRSVASIAAEHSSDTLAACKVAFRAFAAGWNHRTSATARDAGAAALPGR